MHSSVKMTNRDGQSIKFTPIKRNGLDYIKVLIVIPTAISSQTIRPTAYKANILSPQLIHQKCGHFFNERIEELVRRELVDGLPKILPKMSYKCPICLLTKFNHHPRRPLLTTPYSALVNNSTWIGVSLENLVCVATLAYSALSVPTHTRFGAFRA